MEYPPSSVAKLSMFYQKVDNMVHYLTQIHQNRLQCKKGCNACCQDDLSVMGLEAAYIKQSFPSVLHEKASNIGQCAFLNIEGACRIYEARPFICRTHGLPLKWNMAQENQVMIDICELNETEEPLTAIPTELFFDVNLFEEVLLNFQIEADQGKMDRIKLRELFK
jgi:Fe-S-cluster containining protein